MTATGSGEHPDAGRASSRDTVQSVERAVAVLDVLGSHRRTMSAAEVAEQTGLSETIVHRLLRTLAGLEVVERPRRGQYGLGPAVVRYGQNYMDRLPLQKIAIPYMVALGRVIESKPWIVALAVPAQTSAVLIDRLWQPGSPLDLLLALGATLPFGGSANGRVQLATFPEAEVVTLLGEDEASRLRPRLAQIRERDYLDVSEGEIQPGIHAIAAAIRRRDGRAVGSIALSGFDPHEELRLGSSFAHHLVRTARSISTVMP